MKTAKQSIDLEYKGTKKRLNLRTALISLCMFAFVGTSAQTGTVTVKLQNASVKELFSAIENQTSYRFSYRDAEIKGKGNVTISATNRELKQLLEGELSKLGLKYAVSGNKIIVTPVAAAASAQPKKVTGKVVDANGEPVIGATIKEQGTANGTITDFDGNFALDVADNAMLEVSYIGYKSQELKAVAGKMLSVTLREDTEVLDEVVVVGYGSVKKGNLTTAVTAVKSDMLENRPTQSVTDALQGVVPGLNIVQSSRPGKASTMELRGATSLNDSGSPLLLIDGVPGEFDYLNVDDIESISVLKDAASAAIYGSRAAHGVVLVTTKRGKSEKPTLRYNGSVGINTPTDMPEMVSSAEYARVRNEALRNVGREELYTVEDIRKFASGEDLNRYPNTDWLDLMFQNSITTRHSLAATGGTDNIKYYLSGGFDHQTGVVPEISQDVFNVRSNVDANITSKLKLSFDLRYILKQKDEVNGLDGIITDIYKMNPTQVGYYTDGTYGYNSSNIVNPIAYLHETGHEANDTHDVSGIFKLEYEILDGLKFTGLANVNYVFGNITTIGRQYNFTNYFTKEEIPFGQNTLSEKRTLKSYYNLQALLTYQKKIKEHSFDVMLGYQQENQKDDWISAYRDGFPTDLVHVIDGGSKDNWENGGNAEHWSIASFIGSLNYDYASKYLLTFKVRTDGSSRLASGKRWSTFPSVAGAWRITGEDFMESTSSFLDDLKLRASWGITGASSGVGLYPSYTTIGMGGVVLNNVYRQTAYLKSLGNTDLGWEKTNMVDVGLDMSLFNNRLGVTFDYYIKKTNDILIELPVPLEYGLGKPKVNVGTVRNNGWELSLNWNDKIGGVTYHIQGNLSDNKNEVLDLGGTGPWVSGYTDVGLPMNSLYGYEALGFFQSEEEIIESPFQNVKNKPGDIKYKDQNNDNVIDGEDRVVIGDSAPHYLYGLRLTAEWKGFDISMFFQGVGKKDYLMSGPGVQPLTDSGKGAVFEHQLDYWTENNRDAKYPRILESNQATFNYEKSDFWKINAGYFRMKNLQIGYNFSSQLLKNTALKNLRLYFSASNLFTIDNFVPGYDPETTSAYTYPLARTYSLGINVQF